MKLFHEGPRTDRAPSPFGGGSFEFYDSSAIPSACRVRDLLERWFAEYPAEHQAELRARFMKGTGFDGAFFELVVHALLRALGCEVAVHSAVASGRRPDFLASPGDETDPFFVEAISVSDISDAERRVEVWRDTLTDTFNALSIDFPWLWIAVGEIRGRPTGTISARQARRCLADLLARAGQGKIAAARAESQSRELAQGTCKGAGVSINLMLFTRPESLRVGPVGRLVVSRFGGFRWVRQASALYSAVDGKAGRYGRLDHPLVIAINGVSRWGIEWDDVMVALAGEPPHPDGVFSHDGRPKNTRLSAVLVTRSLYPTNIPMAPVRVYHHPHAAPPLGGPLLALPQAVQSDAGFLLTEGRSFADLFQLPPGWVGHFHEEG